LGTFKQIVLTFDVVASVQHAQWIITIPSEQAQNIYSLQGQYAGPDSVQLQKMQWWPDSHGPNYMMMYAFELSTEFHKTLARYALLLPSKGAATTMTAAWQCTLAKWMSMIVEEKGRQLQHWRDKDSHAAISPWSDIQSSDYIPMVYWLKPSKARPKPQVNTDGASQP
jgi:hypothetical protein